MLQSRVSADRGPAIRTAMLHILETVDAERQEENDRTQEAKQQAHKPRQRAGMHMRNLHKHKHNVIKLEWAFQNGAKTPISVTSQPSKRIFEAMKCNRIAKKMIIQNNWSVNLIAIAWVLRNE